MRDQEQNGLHDLIDPGADRGRGRLNRRRRNIQEEDLAVNLASSQAGSQVGRGQ